MVKQSIRRPELPAQDSIDFPLEVDINRIVRSVVAAWRDSPVLRTTDAASLEALLPERLPRPGVPLDEALEELQRVAVTFARRDAHPGFHGYLAGPGLPTDPLGHALAAALNQNVVGYPSAPGAATVERTLVRWLRALAGLPPTTDGVFLSGGSIGNQTALAAALYSSLGPQAAQTGLAVAAKHSKPVMIAAASTHFSIHRAARLLGVGSDGVHTIATDAEHRMDVDALRQALHSLAARPGLRPVCVVASAGTTLTGAIDPLVDIAALCREHGIWLHVDAAYGAAALLAEELRPRLRGIELADSLVIDLHKWFYLAFDASVLLLREPDSARNLFYWQSDYVRWGNKGPPEEHMFFHLSPELSRRARALPAYLALRHYGAERLGRNVLHNVECACYLAELVAEHAELELVSAPQLSVCCFRYAPPALRWDSTSIDRINAQIRDRLEAEGDFYLSRTHLDDRPVLRVCIVSHTTRAEHVETLLDAVLRIGRAATSPT